MPSPPLPVRDARDATTRDRWHLDCVPTPVPAFAGDGHIGRFQGNGHDDDADDARCLGVETDQPLRIEGERSDSGTEPER